MLFGTTAHIGLKLRVLSPKKLSKPDLLSHLRFGPPGVRWRLDWKIPQLKGAGKHLGLLHTSVTIDIFQMWLTGPRSTRWWNRGGNLSFGQRQLLCLARMVLRTGKLCHITNIIHIYIYSQFEWYIYIYIHKTTYSMIWSYQSCHIPLFLPSGNGKDFQWFN